MYYDYASGAFSTPGWHTVAGDRHNDAHAKEIWNRLPNGAIVFWETTLIYGTTCTRVESQSYFRDCESPFCYGWATHQTNESK